MDSHKREPNPETDDSGVVPDELTDEQRADLDRIAELNRTPEQQKRLNEFVANEIVEVIRSLDQKYPIIQHTNAGRLSSTVRRMKAEKELDVPIAHRTGHVISVKSGKPANEMDESEWESLYSELCDELKQRYPELYDRLFAD
jgi:hypothetical protein